MLWTPANHDRKLVLFFNPKCACSTLKHWFNRTLASPEPDIEAVIHRYFVPIAGLERYRDYRWILVVRDPLRRLVSFYANWVVRDREHYCFADANRRIGLADKSFRDFLLALYGVWLDGVPFQSHLVAQTRHLGGLRFDHVLCVERLDEELSRLGARLDLPPPVERRNVTRYDPAGGPPVADWKPDAFDRTAIPSWERFFDDELRALAGEIYEDDQRFYERHRSAPDD